MPRMHCIVHGTGTPKDRDEVNKRDACEWDGWVCERDVIGAPSIFKFTRIAAALARVVPILDLSCARKAPHFWYVAVCCAGWTPEAAKKRSVSRCACKNSNLMNSLCNLPEVLAIAGMKAVDIGGLLLKLRNLHASHALLLWTTGKARAKENTYKWVLVQWKTKS